MASTCAGERAASETPGAKRAESALLTARFNGAGEPCGFTGYVFSVDARGRWQIIYHLGEAAAVVADKAVARARWVGTPGPGRS